MHALLQMGIDFDLTTLKSPDISKLENSYGKKLVSIMKSIKKINVINIIEELRQQQQAEEKRHHKDYNYDITINTNGDAAPYFHPSFSKDNAITYCHFPSTKDHLDRENIDYLKTDIGMTEGFLYANDHEDINNPKKCKSSLGFSRRKEYFEILKYGYCSLMRNSKVVTNSEFSRRAIAKAFGLDNVLILSPPIDIETFRNVSLLANSNNEQSDMILVISRIAPHKQIENAIKLAKILKDNNIGKGMKIIGNLYYYYFDYYSELKQMVLNLGLTDYVKFEINASLNKLLSSMRESRVYFHPMVGEHFGISALEAMAAGLITVVPNEGGIAEFVPPKYQYTTIEQAAKIIIDLFNCLPKIERVGISTEIDKFSDSHYIEGFQAMINELLARGKK
jgi:hypothetical protein